MKIKDVPKIHRVSKVGKRILVDEDKITKSLVMESYYDFVREAWSIIVPEKPTWNWHIEYSCNQIQDMLERVFTNKRKTHDLVLNQPPATTKSKIFSVFLLPWAWTRMPSFRMAGVSYAQELSLDLSSQSRRLVKSDWYQRLFPEIQLSKDQDTKHFFSNTLGGQRYSAGSGGTILGKHFHLLSIDDPINPQEALSDAEVERTNRWITDTLMSRKVDENIAVVMLVMQRLRQNDPAAMFANQPGVRQIVLPATNEYPIKPEELEKRYVDGLLDPVRLSREILKKKKDGMDEYGFSAQYGQCLVSGTLVSTHRGDIPIESVLKGDYVHTRKGLKRVLWSGQTGTSDKTVSVSFSNGQTLTGTTDHPIWTENRSWVAIDSIQRGDIILTRPLLQPESRQWDGHEGNAQNLSGSKDGSTLSPQSRNTSADGNGTISEQSDICIEMSGDTTTVLSQKDTTFTTLTKTRRTTNQTTSDVSQARNTEKSIPRKDRKKNISTVSVISGTSGTRQKKGRNTTGIKARSLSRNSGTMQSTESTNARNAERSSSPDRLERFRSIAVLYAKNGPESANTKRNANNAEASSLLLTTGYPTAPGLVEHCGDGGKAVYDLTVEDCPEFFANGILVHNSPVPLGGGMFMTKLLKYTSFVPKLVRIYRFWDKANTKNRGAYTVGVKMGLDSNNGVYVLDVVRGRWDTHTREVVIRQTAWRDGKDVFIGLEQEPGSGAKEGNERTMARLIGFKVKSIAPKGDKEMRAVPFSTQVNASNVTLVTAPWNKDYVEELAYFPYGSFKDQVDASSGAFTCLTTVRRRIGAI